MYKRTKKIPGGTVEKTYTHHPLLVKWGIAGYVQSVAVMKKDKTTDVTEFNASGAKKCELHLDAQGHKAKDNEFYFPDGSKILANYAFDADTKTEIEDGAWLQTNADESLLMGQYAMGKRTGTWAFYSAECERAKEIYYDLDGSENGFEVTFGAERTPIAVTPVGEPAAVFEMIEQQRMTKLMDAAAERRDEWARLEQEAKMQDVLENSGYIGSRIELSDQLIETKYNLNTLEINHLYDVYKQMVGAPAKTPAELEAKLS